MRERGGGHVEAYETTALAVPAGMLANSRALLMARSRAVGSLEYIFVGSKVTGTSSAMMIIYSDAGCVKSWFNENLNYPLTRIVVGDFLGIFWGFFFVSSMGNILKDSYALCLIS